MRKFYLEDQKGERVPLNNETGIFLYDPEGLGIEYSHDYGESGSGFFMRIKDGISQLGTSFTLVMPPEGFSDSPYERYKKFLDWIYKAEELYFIYCPYGNNEYYKHIELRSIEKTEYDKYGSLQPRVTIVPLTPWYLPNPIHVNFGEESENALRFDYEYTDELVYGIGSQDYMAEVEASGHMPSAIKLTFEGQVIDPVFTLRGAASRKVYGICSVSGIFVSTDKIVFSTAEQDSYIKKIDKNGKETDLLDAIDITTNPFFRIPLSEPCEVSLSGDGILGKISMLQYVYYRGV